MNRKQQDETLQYFNDFADEWKQSADGERNQEVNMIQQRNDCVLHVIDQRQNTELVLDAGCGTGDLTLDSAQRGIIAEGVDFAPEMIKIAEQGKRERKLDNAQFHCCSIFEFDFGTDKWDVISANGFIEYISFEQMESFLKQAYKGLKPGGDFVVGSRNRLFNLVSLNRFTEDELAAGGLEKLISEAILYGAPETIKKLSSIEAVKYQSAYYKHPETGVKVATRFQYTPAQLVQLCSVIGFHPVAIYPVHIHGVPTSFKNRRPEVHFSISNALQPFFSNGLELVPFSSTFMLHLTKG